MRTQVVIVGGGPAGTLLSQLLDLEGIENIVLELRSRDYVLSRVRAGVLEQGSLDVLRTAGVGERIEREGQFHDGVNLAFAGRMFRVDLKKLADRQVMIYGQTEVQRDLYDARDRREGQIIFEVEDVEIHNLDTELPFVTYRKDGGEERIDCQFVAGCDGSHGVTRASIPADLARTYERGYPFGWVGILSETPPVNEELIYNIHERGFALCTLRSAHLSRYYLQCQLDDDLADWPDDRFWEELTRRVPPSVAERLVTGPSIEKLITPLRSSVTEPMRFERLFLTGDAAHTVPPTGAKGLNLAISDVAYLARGLGQHHRTGSMELLDAYSDTALRRVWKAVRFSWWMTNLTHRFEDGGTFRGRIQEAELDYLATSIAAQTSMAENYAGLPL
jgi:p-hydroxybenzoate 3-monooxygenase